LTEFEVPDELFKKCPDRQCDNERRREKIAAIQAKPCFHPPARSETSSLAFPSPAIEDAIVTGVSYAKAMATSGKSPHDHPRTN